MAERISAIEVAVLVFVFTLCAGNIFSTHVERKRNGTNCGQQGFPAFTKGVRSFNSSMDVEKGAQ